MPGKRKPKICGWCEKTFTPKGGKPKTCSRTCGQKLSYQLKGPKSSGATHSQAVGFGTKGSTGKIPESLLELSSRTIRKILKRLEIGCSRCKWNEGTCDIHHIHGRKIENPNKHNNLTYICPNCHRLFHEKKIGFNDVITLEQQIGDNWKKYYYG